MFKGASHLCHRRVQVQPKLHFTLLCANLQNDSQFWPATEAKHGSRFPGLHTGSGFQAQVLGNEGRYAKSRGGSGFIDILKISGLSGSQQLQSWAGRLEGGSL